MIIILISYKVLIKFCYFQLGWFAAPIFSPEGDYPSLMVNQIAINSKSEGRHYSRLPTLSRRWVEIIRGSADFLGLNYYTSLNVEAQTQGPSPSYERDRGLKLIRKCTDSNVFCPVPQGLGDILRYFSLHFFLIHYFIEKIRRNNI